MGNACASNAYISLSVQRILPGNGWVAKNTVEKILEIFPEAHVAMKWPIFEQILDMDIPAKDMKGVMVKNTDEFVRTFFDWKAGVENQLVECLREDSLFPVASDPLDGKRASMHRVVALLIGAVETSPPTTPHSSNVSLLLRADSIFRPQESTDLLFFPSFLGRPCIDMGHNIVVRKWDPEAISHHRVARLYARALLQCLNKPNASYLRMTSYGRRFLCGRCYDVYPKLWEEIVRV